MDRKGFTLFTALLSFILIVLATLFISNMILTSRTTSDIITSIEEQSRMQAIADLARADAVQAFNYNTRWKFENYFLRAENEFPLRFADEQGLKDWDELQNEFAEAFFANPETGTSQFAGLMTENIQNILDDPPSTRGYEVSLVNRGRTSAEREKLREVLTKIFFDSIDEDDFFTIIGCDEGEITECEQGTFYINLKLDEISDEDYEALPQIRVYNPATGRVVREPLLPRTTFRIYVPVRFFRAMAFSWDLAKTIHDPNFRNQMKGAGLGMCEASCQPREWIYAGNTVAAQKLCPGDRYSYAQVQGVTEEKKHTYINFPQTQSFIALYGAHSSYDASSSSALPALRTIVSNIVWQNAKTKMNGWQLEDMELIGSAFVDGEAKLLRFTLEEKILPSASITPYYGNNFTGVAGGGNSYQGYCHKIDSIGSTVAFKELDQAYIVNQDNYNNELAAYKIKILDVYEPEITPFTCKSRTQCGSSSGLPLSGPASPSADDCAFSCARN